MNLQQQEAYFKDMAVHHKQILHQDVEGQRTFKRDSIDNLISSIRTDFAVNKRYALVLENPEGELMDGYSDNPRDNQRLAFWIIKSIEKGNIAQDLEVRSTAKEIAKGIISKIRRDQRRNIKDPLYSPYLKCLDLNNVQYHQLAPVLDSCVGIRVELAIHEFIDLSFKADDWTY